MAPRSTAIAPPPSMRWPSITPIASRRPEATGTPSLWRGDAQPQAEDGIDQRHEAEISHATVAAGIPQPHRRPPQKKGLQGREIENAGIATARQVPPLE